MLDLSNSLNAAMYPISSSGENTPTGSGQHELVVSDDEQPDTIMIDAGTENVYEIPERQENMAPKTQGFERGKVSDAPKLLNTKEAFDSIHPKKTYSSDILKIQQIHAFDNGSDHEISTA